MVLLIRTLQRNTQEEYFKPKNNMSKAKIKLKGNFKTHSLLIICFLHIKYLYWGGSEEEMVTPSQSLKPEL